MVNDPALTVLMPTTETKTAGIVDQSVLTGTDVVKAGEMLGHYRIVNALGRGGMGTVYRALDESLQRYVALKVIRAPADRGAEPQHMHRLLQEAIAQARVNHPHIAHIYYVGVEGESPFFAMELVNGLTLTQRLQEGPLTFPETIGFAQQIVSALAHAVEFDIIHGDIKPGNILLSSSQTVKLSDFGLARRLSEMTEHSGAVAGTPDYLAPEVIAGNPLTVRSDMYSLGVTLFEMTFGRFPYAESGNSVVERLRAHREQPVDFPIPWPNQVPEVWRDVLQRLLNKDPAARYPSYEALVVDLDRLRPIPVRPAGRVPRGLAWLVDLGLAFAAQQIIAAPAALLIANLTSSPGILLRLAVPIVSGVALLLASLLQASWSSTPGKKVFQLRVVDRHGVTPRRPILFARMVTQLLPLWAVTVSQICDVLGLELLGRTSAAALAVAALLDAGFALFHRRNESLHDRLFQTRVVLDAEGR
jgi:DNA-binding helix-hairpin-helix protein with protein kinase domain